MLKVLLLVALAAVLVYLVVRVAQRGSLRPPKKQRPAPPRVLGPDDDPDFLRDLERKRKRKHPEDPEPPPAV